MPKGFKSISYADYYNFSKGYNDTAAEELLDNKELIKSVNMVLKENGALHTRNGTTKINSTSKNCDITKRFEYLIKSEPYILEVYGKKLYGVYDNSENADTYLTDVASDKPAFVQQQDVLYICDGNDIYELGQKDYFSNVGTVDIKINDIVQISDDFSGTGTIGNFYMSKVDRSSVDLKAENYNDTTNWEDVTGINGAVSDVIRSVKPYQVASAEVTKLSIFGTTTYSGTIAVTLNEKLYDFSIASGKNASDVATSIATTAATSMKDDYTVTANGAVVTFTAKKKGYAPDGYVTSNTTGITVVMATATQGSNDDNILDEVRNCTLFARHTKSARYVAAGNPNKPYSVYFSEPNQMNYYKRTNVLTPMSSEGRPQCILNMIDSVLIGYKTSWYEYTGIDPASDGTWKRLALPFGCIAGESVQLLDLYNFVYLGQNGLNIVNSNILYQYGYIVQNNSGAKSISNGRVENTLKSIVYPEKCVSVYHDNTYYLAFCDDATLGKNNKVLTYDTEYKAYSLFEGLYVNDFLYRFDGTLEIASKNYSLLYNPSAYTDIDVETGEEKKIEFDIVTGKLNLDSFITNKFFDKVFLKFKQNIVDPDEHIFAIITINDKEYKEPLLSNINSFIWGEEWGEQWGKRTISLQSLFMREVGTDITLRITNKFTDALDSKIVLYGFSISYKAYTPYQYISNNKFNG